MRSTEAALSAALSSFDWQIFDILPIYGTLRPNEAEQITLTFYGHANIVSEARAVCVVEGGPSYEITLKGEASLVDYKFDFMKNDYGNIVSILIKTFA